MRGLIGLVGVVLLAPVVAGAEPPASGGSAAWTPALYPFCMDMFDSQNRTLPEQARLLRELGYEGAGYRLTLDGNLEKALGALDDAGLKLLMVYAALNVDPQKPAYEPGLPEAIARLKGRPVIVCLSLRGLPTRDPRGNQLAVTTLRALGDQAAVAGVRIAIYHHTNDWTESFLDAVAVAEQVNHPQVGVVFNLCHWLKIEGKRDYRPVLREHVARIFTVSICGAKIGADAWTHGLIQPLGDGDFDVPELLAVLRDAGFRGPVGLQCYGIPGDARDYLQQSMRLWRQWGFAAKP